MTNQPLLGKSALVTGGARRVGRGIALALAQAGADVAITSLTSRDEAAQTASEIESLGRRALAVECDVRSEAFARSCRRNRGLFWTPRHPGEQCSRL